MLIMGRCGFSLKVVMSNSGGIWDVTPGNSVSKKVGTRVASCSRKLNREDPRNRMHVKDPSCRKLAMLIPEEPRSYQVRN